MDQGSTVSPVKPPKRKGGRPPKAVGEQIARETVNAILDMTEAKGWPPSRRELADRLNRSLAATFEHLEVLRKRGLIDYEIGTVRSLTVTPAGERFVAEATEAA